MSCSFFRRLQVSALTAGFSTMRRWGKTPPPKTVIWECTLDCTMACIHCGASLGYNTVGEELSTEAISGIIRDLADLGVKRFLVTGGEPLLRADLLDVLEQAKECGMETGFSTNGLAVSEVNIGRIVRVADSVQVSVDGTKKIHDALRKTPGAFTGAITALNLLRSNGCRQTCMTSVISPLNIHELDNLYELAQGNADLWRVGTVMPVGRASADDTLFVSDGQLRLLLEFIAEKMQGTFPVLIGENLGYLGDSYEKRIRSDDLFFCGAGILSCCIGVDGRVRGCPELPPDPRFVAGDLRTEGFREIWERGFDQYRDTGVCPTSSECSDCPDLEVCRGGCRVMSLKGMNCTKKRVGPSSESGLTVGEQ